MKNTSDPKQNMLLEDFYRELQTYTGQIPWLVPVLLAVPCILVMCIPLNILKDNMILAILAGIMSQFSMAVLYPCLEINYRADPKVKKQNLFRVLKYLPVSRKQIRRYLLEYLWRYDWKMSLTAVSGQALFSCLSGNFYLRNIFLVLLITMVLPMGIGISMIYEHTKEKQ